MFSNNIYKIANKIINKGKRKKNKNITNKKRRTA